MDPTEIGQRTRGERLAEATGAPRRPHEPEQVTLTGRGKPDTLPPGARYRDIETGRMYVGTGDRWPVNPPEHETERESAPAPVEKYEPGVATDPIGIVLMVALTIALILVAAGEFTVAHYLAQIAAAKS